MDVLWAGWRTTTRDLQQAGWELSAEQDIARGTLRILMRHAPQRLYALTRPLDFNYFAEYEVGQGRYAPEFERPRPPLIVQYLSSGINVIINETKAMSFEPIDAVPQMAINTAPKNIEDFKVFAVPMARTEEIIVEPQEVEYFLGKILELQKPKQKEIRSRLKREGEIPMEQVFHAQILSFKQA